MTARSKRKIDPSKIFEQADCFYTTLAVLCNVEAENTQLGVTLGEPAMVIGALTIELFFKCLLCVELGHVPRGHNLRELYEKLSSPTRDRIEQGWDKIAAHRAEEWIGWRKPWALRLRGICRPLSQPVPMRFTKFATATKEY